MLTFFIRLVIMNKNRGVIPDFSRERIMIIMKKTLAIVLALAMVFVMGFSAFAEGEDLAPVKPTDPAELGVYYAELLNAEDSDPAAVAQMILDDLIIAEGDEGIYTVEDLPTVLAAFAENSTDVDKLAAAAGQITAGLEDMGIVLPEIDDVLPPAGEGDGSGDENLPEDEEPTDDTDFLNTILGILGSIGDMIFGGGSDDPSGDDPSGDNGDDAWGDGDADTNGDDDNLVSDTGDTTVISVAAVALVAGAALVLTRKKSEDAE